MQQLTVQSFTGAVQIAQQIGAWDDCPCCQGVRAYRVHDLYQPFAHIAVRTPLDERIANRRMIDAALAS